MTLDFKKLLKNAVVKQLTIQHVDIPDRSVQVFRKEELITCQRITQALQARWGESFMLDGDVWVFFSDQGSGATFDKEFAEKTLFKVVNLALGESANSMNATDLKLFSFGGEAAAEPLPPEGDPDEVNAKAVEDVLDDGGELDESVEEPSDGEKFVFLKITMK